MSLLPNSFASSHDRKILASIVAIDSAMTNNHARITITQVYACLVFKFIFQIRRYTNKLKLEFVIAAKRSFDTKRELQLAPVDEKFCLFRLCCGLVANLGIFDARSMIVIKDNCGIINYQPARSRRNFQLAVLSLKLDCRLLTLPRDFLKFFKFRKIESTHNDDTALW